MTPEQEDFVLRSSYPSYKRWHEDDEEEVGEEEE